MTDASPDQTPVLPRSMPSQILVVSRFRVRNGMDPDVRAAFRDRPGLVDNAPGFLGLEVFQDNEDKSVFYLVTRWSDQESFLAWHGSAAHHASHERIPHGLKLDASYTRVWRLDRIEGPSAVGDIAAGALPLIGRYFAESRLAHILAADLEGRPLFRNENMVRRLGPALETPRVWDWLIESDARRLQVRVAAGERNTGRFLLNFVDADSSPFTLWCHLDVRPDHFVLVGEPEVAQERALEQDLLDMNNQLTVLNRETERQRRSVSGLNARLEAELEQRRRTEEALRQSNQDLDHFASILSHDLMAPMNAIGACVQLLETKLGERVAPDIAQTLGFIRSSAADLRSMLAALREYSSFAAPDPRRSTVDLQQVLESTLANLREEIARTGAVVERGELPPVHGNAAQLQRLLQNLIQNAIKYRSRDRRLLVRVTAESREQQTVFAVADNASGMSAETAAVVFQLFRRGEDQEESGLGIGLATCRRIVEQHGGRIWIESRPGVGSTFFFTLPAALPA